MTQKQKLEQVFDSLAAIVICVWADNFKNSDAKLDAIDKIAEEALALRDEIMGTDKALNKGTGQEESVIAPEAAGLETECARPVSASLGEVSQTQAIPAASPTTHEAAKIVPDVEKVANAIAVADGVLPNEIVLSYWLPHAKAAIAATLGSDAKSSPTLEVFRQAREALKQERFAVHCPKGSLPRHAAKCKTEAAITAIDKVLGEDKS